MFMFFRNLTLRCSTQGYSRKMDSLSFVQQLNPIINKMGWKVVQDDYDFHQEIATSCYGDMLHDEERNKKFGEALKIAIDKLHSAGKKAHVLDIGTGTGLLSMLAVQHGADSVVACEAFLPMANCAINVLKENNFSDKIKIFKSHSTALTVGEKGEMKQKANILVSEVFDTELIGEGAIKTFNHAFENLLEEDCIVIPSHGTVYAQVIESDLAQKWNKLKDWSCGDDLIVKIPKEIRNCPGAAAVHDIQLSEFDRRKFKALSKAVPIYRFEWARNKKIPTHEQNKSVIKAISSGKAQVLFMWWELEMDQQGKIIISCAPVWEHPDVKGRETVENIRDLTKILPWRDHWMQAVYFFTNETMLTENDSFTLVSNHDEFSFWFQIEHPQTESLEVSRPICKCSFHFLLSRTRIGAINDDRRRKSYLKSLKGLIKKDTICIVLSDISLLGVLSAKLGAKKVFVFSDSPSVDTVSKMLSVENNLTEIVSVKSSIPQIIEGIRAELNDGLCNVLILSEPYFRNSILPWHNLAIWFMKDEIVNGIKNCKVGSVTTFPFKCKLNCCAVQFDNLWKIARPLNTCEGFSMKVFDDLIKSAKIKVENYAEAQPLWEYPCVALSLPKNIFEFDFNGEIPKEKITACGQLDIECKGRCDGIVFWMEYQLSDDCFLSFGPVEKVTVERYITWDMFERQGVHLFREQRDVNSGDPVYFNAEFDAEDGEFNFNFHFKSDKQ